MSSMAESTASMPSKKKQKINPKSGLIGNHGPSKVWDYYNKIEDEATKKYSGKAQCKYCEHVIEAPSSRGTNPLWTHAKKCKLIPEPEGDNSQPLISFKEGLTTWVFDQEKCRRALAAMIVIDELPFSVVEKEGFKKFCEQMQPRFHVICRTTITKDCLLMFFQEKAKMKAYLKKDQLLLKYEFDMLEGSRGDILEKLCEHHKKVVVDGFILKLRNVMYQLYMHYKSDTPLVDEPVVGEGDVYTDHIGVKRLTSKELFRSTLKMKDHIEALNDLDKYLNDSVVDEDDSVFNALAWWREKIKTYHALAFYGT